MSGPPGPSPGDPVDEVTVVAAKTSRADREWITSVYPLYLHDLSDFDDGYYFLDDEGRWRPDHLDDWFTLPTTHPLLIRADGRRVGFAFIAQAPFPYMTAGLDYRMAEFFILRSHRGRGIGRRAACAIFDRFPGRWEVTEMPRNTGAIAFWRRLIRDYTGGDYEDQSSAAEPRQVLTTPRAI